MWLEEVIKLFKQIQETSGTNDKKAIIYANKDNELFKKCLVFLLDGNINTGLSAKKIKKKVIKSKWFCRQSWMAGSANNSAKYIKVLFPWLFETYQQQRHTTCVPSVEQFARPAG